ncbi:hypothetical protein THRCLA_20147 [Thraustotheca clavata]|uniref:PH domain-containing protein n=1 Tax=Thraustotheca clavata TaxID=74557 RepID=A0A1W0ABD3_9STRA|nr:hypothetical protein THRCLA_20147 [Thraustotheca clavata]
MSAIEALEAAVALPGVFSREEYVRTLRRNHEDVPKAAVQLRAKHKWLVDNQLENLSLAKESIQRELKKEYLTVLHEATDKCKCPIVIFMPARFKPTSESEKLVAGNEVAKDHGHEDTSTFEDARRCVVYIMTLAIELMEEERAPGIVYLVDMEHASMVSDASTVHLQLLTMLKDFFVQTVQFIFVLHMAPTNVLMRGATSLALKGLGASESTANKVKFIADLRELQHYFDAPCLPEKYGGRYKTMSCAEWMDVQADIEDVDLEHVEQEEAKTYMTKQARELNGMQYAACSVAQVVEMNSTVLRGALYRNKSGLSWVKMYGVLRPDALLLYEDMKGKMPMVIIPINDEIQVQTAQFADAPRGTFGFRMDVVGTPGGHLLCAGSEKERSNWLQDIQMGIQTFQEQHAREVYEEERKIEMDRAFEKLNMIDLSTELEPSPQPQPCSPVPPNPISADPTSLLKNLLPTAPVNVNAYQTQISVANQNSLVQPSTPLPPQPQYPGIQPAMHPPVPPAPLSSGMMPTVPNTAMHPSQAHMPPTAPMMQPSPGYGMPYPQHPNPMYHQPPQYPGQPQYPQYPGQPRHPQYPGQAQYHQYPGQQEQYRVKQQYSGQAYPQYPPRGF